MKHENHLAGQSLDCCGYKPGHPWYYYLGGRILYPSEIRALAVASGYRGYRADDIADADRLAEPRRSAALRQIRNEVVAELQRDLTRYRAVARALRHERASEKPVAPGASCGELHTAMSLKYAHLYNGFAHLQVLDGLLERQPDLFSL